MYCKHCGNQIDDDSIFCTFCQTKQSLQFRPSGEQQVPAAPTPQISAIPPSKKISKYDESYEKETGASFVGVVILLISFVSSIIGRNNITLTPLEYTTLSIALLITRIIIVASVVNIAKRQNRDPFGWGLFAFFLPSIALIIIGLQKKLATDMEIDDSLPSDVKSKVLYEQTALGAKRNSTNFVKKPLVKSGFIEFNLRQGECFAKNLEAKIDGKVPEDGFYKLKNESIRYQIKTGIVVNMFYTESYKQADRQVLEVDFPNISAFFAVIKTGYRAWINELPAPDGIYKTGLFSKVSIQDGVIVEKL